MQEFERGIEALADVLLMGLDKGRRLEMAQLNESNPNDRVQILLISQHYKNQTEWIKAAKETALMIERGTDERKD